MTDLSGIIKAYDIRGTVPDQINEDFAYQVGQAFVELTEVDLILVAHDMRASSAALSAAFMAGANSRGCDCIDLGLGSTDYLYYASGRFKAPGAMITASHNPARYNGIKLCRALAVPIGLGSGLEIIRAWLEAGDIPNSHVGRSGGRVTRQNLLPDYAGFLHGLVPVRPTRRLQVVADAGNGMAGYTAPAILGTLPIELDPMFFELDGTFPNHEPDPTIPANLAGLIARVRETGADIGLGFDGDADRCCFVDETGTIVPASAITAMIAVRQLQLDPGACIVCNIVTSQATIEVIEQNGGVPILSPVGHSNMKARMAANHAAFGGEHTGHYFFREFWNADSGMLAALHILAALGSQDRPLSELWASLSPYYNSGEINREVADKAGTMARVEQYLARLPGAIVDHMDGLTVYLPGTRRVSLRASNTEPLMRLNVETPSPEETARLVAEVLALLPE